jgi:hypothetical protein
MVVQPIEDVLGVVRGQVVHDDVAPSLGVGDIDDVEQVDERLAAVVGGGEAEQLAATDVKRPHQRERAVTDVLELAADGLAGHHRNVGVAAFQRLNARLLVQAEDVLVGRRVVIDVQDLVAFGAELVVLRGQPHLLPVRLQVRIGQDATNAGVTDGPPLPAQIIAEHGPRPVRDRNAYVAGLAAGLRDDLRTVGAREREGGRPDRGASASLSAGLGHEKRTRHFMTVRRFTPRILATSAVGTSSASSSAA